MNGTEYVSRSLSRLRCWPCRISAPWLIAFRTVPTMMATTSDLVRMREENTVLAAFQSIQPPLILPETFRRSPTNREYTGIGKLFDPGGHPVSTGRRQRREIEGQSGSKLAGAIMEASRMAQELSLERVRQYYGEILKSSADLKTSACCDIGAVAPHIAAALGEVHEEVRARFYGCGSPIPPAIQGVHVLDLGCGAGRDCYILSKLVGPEGSVIGVDMTDAQLAVARRHREYHARKFGHANVEFRLGYIEDLRTARIPDNSVDIVVSNCVLILSPDKKSVFSEIFR